VAGLGRRGLKLLGSLPEAPEAAQQGREAASALADLLLSSPDSDTVLRGQQTEPKQAAWSAPIPLAEIKTIGRRLDGTVNDILLTAMAGAVGRYLASRGDEPSELNVHALVPVSLRPEGAEEELGNRIGVVFLSLPIEISDPAARLRELKMRMDEHKRSPEAPVIYAAMNAFGWAPARVIKPAVDYLCARATVVVTNVKGPQDRLYLAGAPLKTFMFWTPRFGGIGVGISILSYAGEVRVGAISDRDIVADPEVLLAGFQAEFDALLALAREESPPAAGPDGDPAA
jgi:WS/DGAT/MGAT family acyltransferase